MANEDFRRGVATMGRIVTSDPFVADVVKRFYELDVQTFGTRGVWCLIDTVTAEWESNWPGDLLGEYPDRQTALEVAMTTAIAYALEQNVVREGE